MVNILFKNILYKEFIGGILPKLELAYPKVKDGIDRIRKLGIDYPTLCNLRWLDILFILCARTPLRDFWSTVMLVKHFLSP